MRLLLSRFLFIILLIQLTHPVWIWVDYQVRYDYYATVLCVNKNKPELHCNGKCALKKALALPAEEDSLPPALISEWYNYLLGLPAKPEMLKTDDVSARSLKPIPEEPYLYDYLSSSAIFKPPAI